MVARAGSSHRVGLVGLGMLGAPVAGCLVDAGYDVTVFDRVAARMRCVDSVRAAVDAADAARQSDVFFCCVDGPESASAVALGRGGAVAAMHPSSTYVELTTMSIEAVQAEAAECAARGVDFVECPVSGRPPGLTALMGGDVAAVRRAAEVVASFADRCVHVGAVGSGTIAKLVNQYLTYANFMVAAQGLAIAREYGVTAITLANALGTCAGASRSLDLLATVLEQGVHGYGSVDSIRRDIELVAQLVEDGGLVFGALEELHALFDGVGREDPDVPFPVVAGRYGIDLKP